MTDHNGSDPLNTAAEAIGSTLGTVVGTVEKVGVKGERAVSDLREAAARAQVKAAAVRREAALTGRSAVKTVKKTLAKAQTSARKQIKVVKKRATIARASGAKMIKTAKKTVAKAKKSFSRAAKRGRR
jgi:hypothetical protein